ncbi:hypothetical protein SESBI_23523 [Sesbania bispinosa]|nr:hypothetical protein SESBI_23523 [Sesbania bispinosa]
MGEFASIVGAMAIGGTHAPSLLKKWMYQQKKDVEVTHRRPEIQSNPSKVEADGVKVDEGRGEIFGAWMTAQRKSRRNSNKSVTGGLSGMGNGEGMKAKSTQPGRFDLLREDVIDEHEIKFQDKEPQFRDETNQDQQALKDRKTAVNNNSGTRTVSGRSPSNMAGPNHAKSHVGEPLPMTPGSLQTETTKLRKAKILAREGSLAQDQVAPIPNILSASSNPGDPPLDAIKNVQGLGQPINQHYLSGRPPDA